MQTYIDKVKNILEALPYITKFSGKVIVIKYGGAAMVNDELKESFATDITLLKYLGIHPVIVHGGGPFISQALKEMHVDTEFVQGHRRTDRKTMEEIIVAHGGKRVSGITSKTTHLLAGTGSGSKLKKAEEYGVKIMEESEFYSLIVKEGLL